MNISVEFGIILKTMLSGILWSKMPFGNHSSCKFAEHMRLYFPQPSLFYKKRASMVAIYKQAYT
jgi:hypothetical protein